MRKTFQLALCNVAAALALAACGGGGDGAGDPLGPPDVPSGADAEGAYQGNTDTNQGLLAIVLENGEIWALYGIDSGDSLLVEGFVQGAGTARNGTYTTSNGKDFGFVPALAGSLTATYVPGVSINGSVSSSAGGRTFTGTIIPAFHYDYNAPARLSDIAGAWSLTDLDGQSAALSIAANGAVTGSSGGCNFTGDITPRASGKNVFNFTIVFGAAPCALPGQTAQGIAVSNLLNGGPARQLIIAGTNQARTVGTALFGAR